MTYTVTEVARASGQTIVTSAGAVTGGLYKGALVQREVVLPSVDDVAQCLGSGVSVQYGTATLTIAKALP